METFVSKNTKLTSSRLVFEVRNKHMQSRWIDRIAAKPSTITDKVSQSCPNRQVSRSYLCRFGQDSPIIQHRGHSCCPPSNWPHPGIRARPTALRGGTISITRFCIWKVLRGIRALKPRTRMPRLELFLRRRNKQLLRPRILLSEIRTR
jgi:hypothetical protein